MIARPLLLLALFSPGVLRAAAEPPARPLETILDDPLSIDFAALPLDQVLAQLRDQTRANLVPNWPALAAAGIPRNTPVTLRLSGVPLQAILRSLLLSLPATDPRGLNFVVGDNAVELSTNAELGKALSTRVYPVGPLLARPLIGKPGADPLPGRADLLAKILRASLASMGESAALPGRALLIKDDFLAVTTSRRGQEQVQRVLGCISDPVRPGIVPTAAAESVRARRAAEQLKSFPPTPSALLAAAPTPTLNFLLLPGASTTAPADLDLFIDDAGILEIGPRLLLQTRTVPAGYDLADPLRRRALHHKSTPDNELPLLLTDLKAALPPATPVPDLDTLSAPSPCWLAPFGSTLLVQATPALHRIIATRLQELAR